MSTHSNVTGTIISSYRVEELLGSGGMGEVYRGTHVHLRRSVAIKILHPEMAVQRSFQERFLREARSAASLNHSNIIHVYDFGIQDGRAFLVMELVTGGSIATLLSDGPLDLLSGLDLARQAAWGLAFAHERGIVHRDIKPDNLLLAPRTPESPQQAPYVVKIGDFGLVRLLDGSPLTQTGISMGTPAYMSPEQCQGAAIDQRADIYSLGIVLYEMLTGRRPFDVQQMSDAVYQHVYTEPKPLREVRPDLPADVEAIVAQCLAKNPADRYQQMRTLAAAIDAVVAKEARSGRSALLPNVAAGMAPVAGAPLGNLLGGGSANLAAGGPVVAGIASGPSAGLAPTPAAGGIPGGPAMSGAASGPAAGGMPAAPDGGLAGGMPLPTGPSAGGIAGDPSAGLVGSGPMAGGMPGGPSAANVAANPGVGGFSGGPTLPNVPTTPAGTGGQVGGISGGPVSPGPGVGGMPGKPGTPADPAAGSNAGGTGQIGSAPANPPGNPAMPPSYGSAPAPTWGGRVPPDAPTVPPSSPPGLSEMAGIGLPGKITFLLAAIVAAVLIGGGAWMAGVGRGDDGGGTKPTALAAAGDDGTTPVVLAVVQSEQTATSIVAFGTGDESTATATKSNAPANVTTPPQPLAPKTATATTAGESPANTATASATATSSSAQLTNATATRTATATPTATKSTTNPGNPTAASTHTPTSTATATRTATATATRTATATATATQTATPTATATHTPTATATWTPEPTATFTPTATATFTPTATATSEPTSTEPSETGCVYDGPTYDGYACDFNGQFYVTVTGCTADYVQVDWGDGGRTEWQGLEPGQQLWWTYSAPGVYYATMHAEFSPDYCSNTSIDLTFVFEYPAS